MEYIPKDFEKPPSLYNGRVNLMNNDSNDTNNNHENAFLMQDRIPVKSNDYNDALQGEIHDTKLSKAFFSFENQEIIQNGLRKGVYDLSQGKYLIDRQDPHVIQMVMRTTFFRACKSQCRKYYFTNTNIERTSIKLFYTKSIW